MRAITRGSAMVATKRSRPPQSGHARTSRPKVRRRSSGYIDHDVGLVSSDASFRQFVRVGGLRLVGGPHRVA